MTLSEYADWYHARYHRTSSALTTTALIIADLIGAMFSFGSGFFLVNLYDINAINFKSFVTYWPYLPVFVLFFQIVGLYPGLSLAPSEELRHFTLSSLMAHGGIIFSRYIEDQEFEAISVAFIISFFFSPAIFILCRNMMHYILAKTGLGGIPTVIFGSGATSHMVIDRLRNSKRTGYVPVLLLDNGFSKEDLYRGIPIIHDLNIGHEIARRFKIRVAIVAMPKFEQKELAKLLNDSVSAFRYSILVPDFFSVTNIWMSVRDFDGVLGFVTSHRLRMFWNLGIKRLMDLGTVIIGGFILLPLFLIISVLVKISSPGPVLYGHKRLGQNGKPFTAYKFRSMVQNSNEVLDALLKSDSGRREEWLKNHKLKDDPRVTKIGKFLRHTSLDEFPQLINILKGEMSLVGPRPIVDEELEKYGENFNRIFSVKPGLTGLWQVSGRSDTDYGERISFDTYYLQSWSVWLDIWILYKTFGVVLRGKGAY
jgi:Undecaprenyl-phosphate galactose phosphotransferase WbaP